MASDVRNDQQKGWWDASFAEGARRDRLYANYRAIDDSASNKLRHAAFLNYYSLYNNAETRGFGASQYLTTQPRSQSDVLRFNLVQSAIDTLGAKIGKNRPKPMFLTQGGNWGQQRKAKKLTKLMEGEFKRLRLHEDLGPMCFLHAGIFGDGFAHFFEEDDQVAAEWVFPSELKVDDQEAVYGMPRTLYRAKVVAKETLAAKYPDKADDIWRASTQTTEGRADVRNTPLCLILEAWHLGTDQSQAPDVDLEGDELPQESKSKGETGRHILALDNVTLVDEEYEIAEFPFVKMRLNKKPLGFWDRGFCETLKPIQAELTRALMRLQECFNLCAVLRILSERSADVNYKHLNNVVGTIVEYTTTRPELWNANGVPPEILGYVDHLIQMGYQEVGISQLSAQSQKPAGLNSGKALREFSDIESERFVLIGQQYEQFFMDSATHIMRVARGIAERTGSYESKAPGKRDFQRIKWSEAELGEDEYVMQVFPVSALSNTPAGRMSDVQDLIDMGAIDKDEGWKLLDFPDLQATTNLRMAAQEDLDRLIEHFLDGGDYQQPDPLQDLQSGIKKLTLAYFQAKQDGAPEEIMALFRDWIGEAVKMVQPTPPPAPMPPAIPVPPQGMPNVPTPGAPPMPPPTPMPMN